MFWAMFEVLILNSLLSSQPKTAGALKTIVKFIVFQGFSINVYCQGGGLYRRGSFAEEINFADA